VREALGPRLRAHVLHLQYHNGQRRLGLMFLRHQFLTQTPLVLGPIEAWQDASD
jgi:hypothetical protein